jgi:D-glycero-alpha-D-manno-heptose-7-phosphate kinase
MNSERVLRIAKAPMRISFIGGGTDFKSFYTKSDVPGRVLGTTINKYVYVMASAHPNFEPFKYKFTYRKTEEVNDIRAFEHPVVRATLQKLNWKTPLNLATMASLPGRSGLGSSSAFTVALLAALTDKSIFIDKEKEAIALDAIEVERTLLEEPGGIQDQYHSAFGGFRLYEFENKSTIVHPKNSDPDFLKLLDDSLYLVASGPERSSHMHASRIEGRINDSKVHSNLVKMSNLAIKIHRLMENSDSPVEKLEILKGGLRESWEIKKRIGVELSPQTLEIIERGASLGFDSFKLCGAGGSGFVAFLTSPLAARKLKEEFGINHVFQPGISQEGVELVSF